MQGATERQKHLYPVTPVSIHAPYAGSDVSLLFQQSVRRVVSIHAPYAGSDGMSGEWKEDTLKFQSTPPMQGATPF